MHKTPTKSKKQLKQIGETLDNTPKLKTHHNSQQRMIQLYKNSRNYIRQKKFDEAQNCIVSALKVQPEHPILKIYFSGIYFKQNKTYKAFQQIRQLIFLYDFQSNKVTSKIMNQYKLTEANYKWLFTKIQQFHKLQQLIKQMCFMNEQGKKLLYENVKSYFQQITQYDFTSLKSQKTQSKFDFLIKKLNQKLEFVFQNINQLNLINITAKQKFDTLIRTNPQMKYYYKKLIQELCSFVQAYRHIATGVTKGGDNGLKSNISKCVSYLKTGLKIAATIPLMNAFAEMFGGIAQLYLQQQIDSVAIKIVNHFRDYESNSKLVNAVIQMVLYLSEQKQFTQLITNPPKEYEYPWYLIIKAKVSNSVDKLLELQDQMLTHVNQFKHIKYLKQQNMAKEHCIQILLTILGKQTFDEDRNLIAASEMWLNEKWKQNLKLKRQKSSQNYSSTIKESQGQIEKCHGFQCCIF